MQSNKFHWTTHEVPRAWPATATEAENASNKEEEQQQQLLSPPEKILIRHLKQGATGAVQTWPTAEVLLDYLVRRGGLRHAVDKIPPEDSTGSSSGDGDDVGVLDLIRPPSPPPFVNNLESSFSRDDSSQTLEQQSLESPNKTYNIVELGGGSGYLSVGLSLALNHREACLKTTSVDGGVESVGPFRPRVRLMCTDNDNATIKNMRHNIARQPRERNVSKAVRVESLGWGDDVGGEKFSKAIRLHFGEKKKKAVNNKNQNQVPPNNKQEPAEQQQKDEDPIRLLSHIVGSDVHWGEATLEPLSSVISALKLRHPRIIVILLIRERTPDAVADLKSQIETKVKSGLDLEQQPSQIELKGFSVSVRDVLHRDVVGMKMVEC